MSFFKFICFHVYATVSKSTTVPCLLAPCGSRVAGTSRRDPLRCLSRARAPNLPWFQVPLPPKSGLGRLGTTPGTSWGERVGAFGPKTVKVGAQEPDALKEVGSKEKTLYPSASDGYDPTSGALVLWSPELLEC